MEVKDELKETRKQRDSFKKKYEETGTVKIDVQIKSVLTQHLIKFVSEIKLE